jgi:hypothetical protein
MSDEIPENASGNATIYDVREVANEDLNAFMKHLHGGTLRRQMGRDY